MNKKYVIISVIVVVLLIMIIFLINKKDKSNGNITGNVSIESNILNFDEETGYYYIKDGETGEILSASKDKNDLLIYIDNPDYKGNPLIGSASSLEEYLLMIPEASPAEEIILQEK